MGIVMPNLSSRTSVTRRRDVRQILSLKNITEKVHGVNKRMFYAFGFLSKLSASTEMDL